jgi:hypothetical protein
MKRICPKRTGPEEHEADPACCLLHHEGMKPMPAMAAAV